MADEKTAIKVLNDETFINALDQIIERDFFPDMSEVRHCLIETNSGNDVKKCFQFKNSLNNFLNKYVSEENFLMHTKIKIDNEEKHKKRYSWLYEQQKSLRFNALMFNSTPSLTSNKKPLIGISHRNAQSIKFSNKRKMLVKKRKIDDKSAMVILETPDILPSARGTPFLTWGNIDHTPINIENCNSDETKPPDNKEAKG